MLRDLGNHRPRQALGWLSAVVAAIVLLLGSMAASLAVAAVASAGTQSAASSNAATAAAVGRYDSASQLPAGTQRASNRAAIADLGALQPATVASETSRPEMAPRVAAEDVTAGAAKAEQYVYRVHGGDSGPMGHSWTPENPMGMSNPRAGLGLPKGNSGQMLTRARVTDMEGVMQRDALPLDGNPGGAPEWLFPDPLSQLDVHWTIPLVPSW